jgi:hypothetical protein
LPSLSQRYIETLLSRVDECLRLARQKGSDSRVFGMSRKTSAECPSGSIAEQMYRAAEEQFRT